MKTNASTTDDYDKTKAAEKATELINQAVELSRHGEYESVITILKQALELAEFAESALHIARCWTIYGIALRRKSDYSGALEYFNKAINLYQETGNAHGIVAVLGNIGNTYRNMAEYSKSLEYYQRALTLSDDANDPQLLANLYVNISVVYQDLGDYEQALEYAERSLKIYEEINDIDGMERLKLTVERANLELGIKEYNRYLEYHKKALDISIRLSNKNEILYHLSSIGDILTDTGHYAEALESYNEALTLAHNIGKKSTIAQLTERCGVIYLEKGFEEYNEEKAERYFHDALSVVCEIGERNNEFSLYKLLSELYKRQLRWKECAEYLEKYIELKDKVQSMEAQKAADKFVHESEMAITIREKTILAHKNQELVEANLFKTKLLGIAAHDLKNPLGNIVGASKLVLSELPKESEHYEWLWIIEQSASRMSSLITELLESAAASLGVLQLSLSTFNVVETLDEVCELNISAIQRKNQKLDMHFKEEIIISGDRTKLSQVFDNIISNAIKYSPKGTTILIDLSADATKTRLKVKDEGQGLSQDDISKLFGQFQKLSSIPTDGESSTGLGLNIVKQIVELHKGKIWAESEGKGKGTTFYVELPINV